MRPDPTRCLLLIDDEPAQRRLVTAIGARAGWWVRGAPDVEAAAAILARPGGADGRRHPARSLAARPRRHRSSSSRSAPMRPDLPLLILTAQTSVAVAVDAMRAGANDFLVKPIAPDRLLAALNAATDRRQRGGELRPLSEKISKPLAFDEIVGSAPRFRSALAVAAKAARARVSVLIEGESGSGKEVIAQAIHTASPRGKQADDHRQLRRDPRQSRRIGAVRPREGRLHRRLRPPYRPLRGCRRLDPVPRRGRRAAARHPGQIAARARDRRDPAHRRPRRSRWSTSGSSPRPTGGWPTRSPGAASARTSITGSTSSMSTSRRCATAPATSRRSPATCSPGSPSSRACAIFRSPTTASRC